MIKKFTAARLIILFKRVLQRFKVTLLIGVVFHILIYIYMLFIAKFLFFFVLFLMYFSQK